MKYARIPMREKDGSIVHKLAKGRIHLGAFEIHPVQSYYPVSPTPREPRMVELISEQEYFLAILSGEEQV